MQEAAEALATGVRMQKKIRRKARKLQVKGLPPTRHSNRLGQITRPMPASGDQEAARPLPTQRDIDNWEAVLVRGFSHWEEGKAREAAADLVKHSLAVGDILEGVVAQDDLVDSYGFKLNIAGRIFKAV